jgi:hypothetical protein
VEQVLLEKVIMVVQVEYQEVVLVVAVALAQLAQIILEMPAAMAV